ncbi:acyltransferase family protein [Frigidibacter oleivorans]|uniref:acyltransferase family protein n=1 Tax=Frigidibacter oleivorans TaxID=2487129 RepID=UPI0013E0057A|nr:acyltransferase family protein [Frigidibacter oleivorans]
MSASHAHRPEIDGLRAIAVLPVILFHAGFDAFAGGYVGVDVFFVISGYLITAILLRDLAEGRFSILGFYERRVRRLLPALFVMLAATLPIGWLLMTPQRFEDYFASLSATALFIANVHFYKEAGYFAAETELQPLVHMWSLAVEEQFYLLFPLALAAVWRWWRGALWAALALAALASFGWSLWAMSADPDGAFFLIGGRAWELLAGGLLALWAARPAGEARQPGLWHELAAGLGLALIVVPMLTYGETTPFPGAAALPPVLGTVGVLWGARQGTRAAALLRARPLVAVGLISYSAYLWHQPVFAAARLTHIAEPPLALMLALVLLSLALAWLSWRFVEQPFRAVPARSRRRAPLFAGAVAGIAVFALAGAAGQSSRADDLWLRMNPDLAPEVARLAAATSRPAPADDGACLFSSDDVDAEWERRMADCHARLGPAIVVLGDSHAIDLMAALAARPDRPLFLTGLTEGGCRPHMPGSDCEFDLFLDYVRTHPGMVARVIYEQAGFYLLSPDGKRQGERALISDLSLDEAVPDIQPNADETAQLVAYLSALARQVDLVWFGPRLEPHVPLDLILRYGCAAPVQLRPNLRAEFSALDSYLAGQAAAARLRYVSQIDMMDLTFPRDLQDCREIFWRDGDHFSPAGVKRFSVRLDPSLWTPDRR